MFFRPESSHGYETEDSDTESLESLNTDDTWTAPHAYHGYVCPIVQDLEFLGADVVFGDLIVYFDAGTYLDEFFGNADEIEDIYGIDYGFVSCDSESENKPVLVTKAGDLPLVLTDQATLYVKVYRLDQASGWRSVIPQAKQPWQGWTYLDKCNFSALTVLDHKRHSLLVGTNKRNLNSELWRTADLFMGRLFKPKY